jgi:hypothetical protein
MSGLLTARVLSDFYDTVTVVERDVLPDGPANRRGVPQDSHAPAARQGRADPCGVVSRFPRGACRRWRSCLGRRGSIEAIFVRRGTPPDKGRLLTPSAAGLSPEPVLLEDHVRRRVLAIPNVTVLDGREVVELTSTTKRDRVTGAVVADRATEERSALTAALVVDATGRGSRTPVFLDRLGYGRPREDVLTVRICYTSELLQLPVGKCQRMSSEFSQSPTGPPHLPGSATRATGRCSRWARWGYEGRPNNTPKCSRFLRN